MQPICPVCHQEYQSAVYCKKERKDICWNHCKECPWFRRITYACLYEDGQEEVREAARKVVNQERMAKAFTGYREIVLQSRSENRGKKQNIKQRLPPADWKRKTRKPKGQKAKPIEKLWISDELFI